MRIVCESAAVNNLSQISQVELIIGPLSGVDVDALQFALNSIKSNTILEESEFIFHSPHLLLFCKNCQNEYVADCQDYVCPACQLTDYEIIQGCELLIKSIRGEKRRDNGCQP